MVRERSLASALSALHSPHFPLITCHGRKKTFPLARTFFCLLRLRVSHIFLKRKNHFPAFRVPDDPQVAPRRRVLQGLLPLPERDPLRAHLQPGVPARQVRRAGRLRVRPGVRRAGLHKV